MFMNVPLELVKRDKLGQDTFLGIQNDHTHAHALMNYEFLWNA